MAPTTKAALLAAMVAGAAAARPMTQQQPSVQIVPEEPKAEAAPTKVLSGLQLDAPLKTVELPFAVCDACIQFAVEGINIVANLILNKDIEEGCDAICSFIQEPRTQKACDYLCDAAGVAAFVEAIEHSDLDPIYYCELLDITGVDVCPIQDCPTSDPMCVKETSPLTVSPTSASKGSEISFSMDINVTAPIGVGMIDMTACSVNGGCHSIGGQIFAGLPVGAQTIQGTFTAGGKDNGGFPSFEVGNNTVSLEVCEGLCDPKGDGSPNPHPHAKSFGKKSATIYLTPHEGPSPAPAPQPTNPWGPMPGPEASKVDA